MKTKDVIELAVAVVIILVVGYVIFLLVGPKNHSSGKGVSVEKISPIQAQYDQTEMSDITNPAKVKDFYVEPDLNSGVGNQQLFGPLK